MIPYIWRIYIRFVHCLVRRREARPYLQVERDDAVATLYRWNSVAVDTRLLVVLLRCQGVIRIDMHRVAGADCVKDMRLERTMEANLQHVDTV